jgi:hypothetical protein
MESEARSPIPAWLGHPGPNGAQTRQPRATPWEPAHPKPSPALKGRNLLRTRVKRDHRAPRNLRGKTRIVPRKGCIVALVAAFPSEPNIRRAGHHEISFPHPWKISPARSASLSAAVAGRGRYRRQRISRDLWLRRGRAELFAVKKVVSSAVPIGMRPHRLSPEPLSFTTEVTKFTEAMRGQPQTGMAEDR